MKLAISNKSGIAYCCLCKWQRKCFSLEDSEKQVRKHLDWIHHRLLVSFIEKGCYKELYERDVDGNFKMEIPERIYSGSGDQSIDRLKWKKFR